MTTTFKEKEERRKAREAERLAWFTGTFLTSLESKATNPKYPNQVILSEKQAEICYKYMECKQCRGDYGFFSVYELIANGKKYQMNRAGRYTFLSWYTLLIHEEIEFDDDDDC